jgi:hypothetical protein
MDRQFTLNASGGRKLKTRLTQDLSYSITEDNISVNDRIDMSQYADMIYRWCLCRTIHFIVALCHQHPTQRIFLSKHNYLAIYCQVAHSTRAAVQLIVIFASITYIALCLAFSGSPNPPTWCAFSKMVSDLSKETPLCPDWVPETLNSPDQPVASKPVEYTEADTPLALAGPMAVSIPTTVTARTDCFIDDLICIFLDSPRARAREPHAVPLAIFVTSHPHTGDSTSQSRGEA